MSSPIKIVCNGCIRRFSLPPVVTFEKFQELVCQNAELPPLSKLTFTFTHPSIGRLDVNDGKSLIKCLEVAALHNIVAKLNVSVDGVPCFSPPDFPRSVPAVAQGLPVNNQSSSAEPLQASAPVIVAAPVAGSVGAGVGNVGNDSSFDANGLVNDVFAQAGAFFSGLQQGSSVAMSGLDGLLSQANTANLANMFGVPSQQQDAASSAQQQPPVVVHAQPSQAEQQKQQQQQQQVPQLPQLPDILGLFSNVMNTVQSQQQRPQQAPSQQSQQQQQPPQPAGIAQLLGTMLGSQGSSSAPLAGLQQMMSILAPPATQNNQQAGNSNNNSNQLGNVVQLAQTLVPLIPQMMSMVVPIMQAQQQQQQRPVSAPSVATSPFGGLGAMAQSFMGTAPRPPASAPVDASGEFAQQLATLADMGFNDRFLNSRLLREANGSVEVVFQQLLRREQFAASLSK